MRRVDTSEALSGLESFGKIWRRRRVFAGVFLGTIVVAVLALVVLPARYIATASVIVAEQEPGSANMSVVWAQKLGDPADMESQLLVVRSPRMMRLMMNAPGVMDAVMQECGRSGSDACQKLKSDSMAFIEHVDNHLSVVSAGRSRVINISYQSAIPQVAQMLANALTKTFLENQREEGANSREVATSWLWQELRQLDDQVREADEKIQKFRQAKGLMRGATAPLASERLSSIGQQLSQAEAARSEASARLQAIKDERSHGLTDAPSVLSSRTIADIKQQLTTVSAQLASASGVLGPKHPSILALSREQSLIQQRLADEMQSIAASAQRTYDANDDLVKSLKKQMDAVKAEAGSATLDETSIEGLVRDTEIKRQQYAALYKKASELETERRVLQGSTRLVSLAELPNKPFFPKKIPFLAAGSTLALILGIAAALFVDRLNSAPMEVEPETEPQDVKPTAAEAVRVSAPIDEPQERPARVAMPRQRTSLFSMLAGAPIVACLPRLGEQPQVSAVGSILQSHMKASVVEVLRHAVDDYEFQSRLHDVKLRLQIGSTNPGQRIVITSPAAGDGKTVTTLALAEQLAAFGCRVLAVECDVSNPEFEKTLEVNGGVGLLGVLAGWITARDAVVRTAVPNLDVLVAGGAGSKGASLLFERRLTDLLSNLSGYDAILIDSPVPSTMPSAPADYFAGIDHVVICMKGDGLLTGRAPLAVANVQALGAGSIAIAITMDELQHGSAFQVASIPTERYARAG